VIGAPSWNSTQGTVYVLVRSGVVWTLQQQLTASDGAASDNFGLSVAISGNTLLIGAPIRNGGKSAAYVFVRNTGMWTQQQEMAASDGAAGDDFGEAVSVSGDTAIISAPPTTSRRASRMCLWAMAESGASSRS